MIIAKAVIPNQYWILKQDDRKVGNIEAGPGGYQVRINDSVQRFKTIPMVRRNTDIEFETAAKKSPTQPGSVYGYRVRGNHYNEVWNARFGLPLFTKTAKSKSWFAAGWYAIHQGRHWKIFQDPKFIILERYPYRGPYHSQEEANAQSI